jgi:hypothetical protein
MNGMRDTNMIMKVLVRPGVYRYHPRAWAAVCFAAGFWLFVLGALVCSQGYWWGALLMAVAALETWVGYHLQASAQT